MRKNSLSIVLFLLLLSLALTGCMSSSTFKNISTADLQKMIDSGNKFTLVDVREADTFDRGHIAGAINLPASSFEENYTQLKPDAKIVLICYSGDTSKSAAQFLLQKGFTDISSVNGGMNAWSGQVTQK